MTLADVQLAPYDRDLTVVFQGMILPIYVLMEKMLKITDKDGNCINFYLKPAQIELYKEICMQRREGKPVRQDVLKSRQIGYSTFIAGLFFIIGMFTPNMKVGVVADLEKHAHDLFAKYEYFYNHLDDNNPAREQIEEFEQTHKNEVHPLSWKPKLKARRGQELLQTETGNSIIEVVVAGEGSGRSNTYHLLHLSECAFFKNLRVTLNGLLETVSSKNKNSFIFLETTANGFNEYKDRWDKDVAGKTSYKAIFTPWFNDPDYCEEEFDKPNVKMPPMEEWLYEKQKQYNLTNGQIVWYWNKYQDKGDKGLTLQEYPFCPTDSFLTSGHCLFIAELIAKRKEEIIPLEPNVKRGMFPTIARYSEDGNAIDLQIGEFLEKRNGELAIYEEPIAGHPYIVNLDPAMGGEDSYVIQVLDNYTCKQVATYRSNTCADDEVAFQLVALGHYYNEAIISAECNNPNGYYILQLADKCGYKFIYQDSEFDTLSDRYEDRFGYKTKQSNKNAQVTMLKLAFRDNYRMINDLDTLNEMEEFEVYKSKTGGKNEQYRASDGAHDDTVMALCGCFLIRASHVQDCLPKQVSASKPIGMDGDPFHRMERRAVEANEVYQKW